LKLLADVGVIGLPNAGKSTLISRISSARPKIADYPFTTLVPNLGVVSLDRGESMVVADIPGLIEGAHRGAGLGHRFLRHVERTRVLLHLVDVGDWAGGNEKILERYHTVNHELAQFCSDLLAKPQIVALNKIDLIFDPAPLDELQRQFRGLGNPVHVISAVTGQGVQELVWEMAKQLAQLRNESRDNDWEVSSG
jgi:GTP-binding protein